MRTRRLLPMVVLSAALAAGAALPGEAAVQPSAGPPAYSAAEQVSTGKDRVITLITGDRVVLAGGDVERATIVPGAGRTDVRFESRRTADEWLVIPSDVQAAVQRGQLDKRLFEVNGLLRDGYDDAARGDIPLLVTGRQTRAKLAHATTTKALASIDGAAVRVEKKNAGAFVQSADLSGRRSGHKIWLDGKLRTTLDSSVPQIGAPAGWQAGYTGKGVKVAVLDSGIDATHPDLAGQVIGSENFTTEPLDDVAGHGTHVASTIAGKGVEGHRGVAPDARLLNGKVCGSLGQCDESSVLAGLDWAVAQQASVVNLSLGGPGPDGIDPLEEAVNRLTQRTGTLFVVAAGNIPGQETVGSPGTAEAALTVGAIDRDEHLADFSSQGPGPGGVIKPDVTAPGVGIVAARSAASTPDEPVGDRFARMSGTSMATPHVAGAAALLVQQHADWKAPELKSALMAAAKPAADLTAYEQGAGRVDLARAITQTVVAETPSISFGTALWPHADDKPVTKQLVYRNLGAVPITVELQAKLATADHQAPAGALRLSTDRLTIPAGGKASVELTSDTTHNGPDGLYDGRILATAGQQQVVTPVVVDNEVESYNLTVTHLGVDGKPAAEADSMLWGLESQEFETGDAGPNGQAVIRLPRGPYLLQGGVHGPAGEYYQLLQPELQVTGDRALVVDARQAKPVSVTVPRQDAKPYLIQAGYERTTPDGTWLQTGQLFFDYSKLFLGRLGDRLPADQMTAFVASSIAAPGPAGDFRNSPYVYSLLDTNEGQAFAGLNRVVRDKDLARVVSTYNGKPGTSGFRLLLGTQDRAHPPLGVGFSVNLPAKVDQYYEPGATEWLNKYQDDEIELSSLPERYRAGTTAHERWNAPVLVPGFAAQGSAVRVGDAIKLRLFPHNDQDGHAGIRWAPGVTKLIRGQAVVAESEDFGTLEAGGLAAGGAQYRLETSLEGTSLVATFRSAEDGPLPLTTVRFSPEVDAQNLVTRKPITVLPFSFDAQPGTPAVKNVTIQYSADGKTWKPAAIAGSRAVFPTPAKATELSLKATVTDRAGNTTTQTVLGAYQLK